MGGGIPPQAPISYLVSYELFETLMYCDPPPSPQPHGYVWCGPSGIYRKLSRMRRGSFDEIVVLAKAAEEQTIHRKKAPYLTWIWHSFPSSPPLLLNRRKEEMYNILRHIEQKSVVRTVYTQPWNTYVQYTTRYWCLQRLWKDFFALLFLLHFFLLHSSFFAN